MEGSIHTFKVAGHVFAMDDILFGGGVDLGNYAPFALDTETAPLFTVIHTDDDLSSDGRKLLFVSSEGTVEPRLDIFEATDGSGDFFADMAPVSTMPSVATLRIPRDIAHADGTSHVCPLYVADTRYLKFAIDNSMMLLFSFATSALHTLEMHASVTVSDGRGYLFLGKSGTGKSTHSRLWLKNIEGSRLLNDDNPILKVESDGTVFVYGSPWSGKTHCYHNARAQVGAIVSLRQAPCNKIEQLGLLDSYITLFSSCSGLKNDVYQGDGIHASIEAIATGVPFFRLDCLPDDDAARVCHDAVTAANR